MDELGVEINEKSTFNGLYKVLDNKGDVYHYIGVSDSLVRERVFEKLADIMGVKYDEIYQKWLDSDDEYKKGGYMEKGNLIGQNIDVFGYTTQNFDMCPLAVEEFEKAIDAIGQTDSDAKKTALSRAAMYVDDVLGVEKRAKEDNIVSKNEFQYAVTQSLVASAYNYASGLEVNLTKFLPMHIFEIATKLVHAESSSSKEELTAYDLLLAKNKVGEQAFKNMTVEERKNLARQDKMSFEEGGSVEESNYRMVLSQAKAIKHHADELMEVLTPDMEVEAWVVGKIERASTDMSDITHYLDGLVPNAIDEEVGFEEGGQLEKGVYYLGKPKKEGEVWGQKIVELDENGLSFATDYARKLKDFPSKDYKKITEEELSEFIKNSPKHHNVSSNPSKFEHYANGGMIAGRWYRDNQGVEYRYIGEDSTGQSLFSDGQKVSGKSLDDFESDTKEKKSFSWFKQGGETSGYSNARLLGRESQDFEKEAREYAGADWDNMSKDEKEQIISDLQNDFDRSSHFADGGEIYSQPLNRATNLKVRDYLEKEGLTKKETAGDYEKFLGQALVTSLRDSNFSKEANEIIYILDKSVKGDEVYDTKYYNPIPSIVRIGEKVAKICKYDAVEITDAYFFISKMYGSGSVASAIGKVFGRYELSGNFKYAKGGGIYSSDSLYYLQVLKDGEEVGREKFRAKSLKEAKEIAEDDYEKDYQSKFGDHLSFIVSEAMAEGGYVAVSEKDGYWYIMSKPTTKDLAEQLISLGVPRGEEGKVVTIDEAKSHKKVIGAEYLADGGKVKEIDMDEVESSAKFYTDESKWSTKPTIKKFQDDIDEYETLKSKLDKKEITPSKVIGTGYKSQLARPLAYRWLNERILVAKRAIEILKERGSEMAKGGFVSKGELVWRKLSNSKKMEFLHENFTPQITPRSQETLVGKDFQFLPKDVKIKLEAKYANVEDYAKGGKLVGKQKNLDVNKNGKLDAEDFKMLRGEKMAKGGEVKVGDVYERKGFGKLKITKIDDGKFRKVYFKYDDNDKEFFEGMYGAEGKIANKEWVKVNHKMAMGGKVKFEDKVKAIKASLLKTKKVPKKVQKDYGKTYSSKEAEAAAKRIAGSMRKKEMK
jgi:hypothetical protein